MVYFNELNKEIIGKKLNKIETQDNHETLLLHTANGIYKFKAEGDCCSNSWVEHFDSPTSPCVITDFKEIEIPPSYEIKPTINGNSEEEIKYYFYEVITDDGAYLIEMRNSSNGYYGGWLEFIGLQK